MSDSDWESDYSSSEDEEGNKRCPHERFRHDYGLFGVGTRIQVVIDASANCLECKLLLQAVSNYRPGWIEDNKDSTSIIYVQKRKTYTVELRDGPKESETIGSFQFVHRSKGV